MPTNNTPRRRRSRGCAWHWRQTDAWYYTPPGTKRRVRLLDEDQRPIRGRQNRPAAELALARIKAAGDWRPTAGKTEEEGWIVAKVCSQFIAHCEQRASHGMLVRDYCAEVTRYLNSLCSYCGALPVAELRKGHVEYWLESHPTWQSSATRRNAITLVLSAFNHAQEFYDLPNPLRGLKKPPQQPRLQSFSPEDERLLYTVAEEPFANFLSAAIQTGVRPICELSKLTADDVVESDRGMLWRIYSSKTKKTRTIPVRSDVAGLVRLLRPAASRNSPVFRNAQGRPWKKMTVVRKFMTIKSQLGWDRDPIRKHFASYTCRHTFAHRMLAGYYNNGVGCSIEVLAELMGNTPKVAFDHYGREWGREYQEPLWSAIAVSKGGSS